MKATPNEKFLIAFIALLIEQIGFIYLPPMFSLDVAIGTSLLAISGILVGYAIGSDKKVGK